MKKQLLPLLFATALVAGNAQADFTLNRDTKLTDAYGGTFTSLTQGTLAAESAERDTVSTFTNFHPNDEYTTVNGQIERSFQRTDENAERTYNGALTIANTPSSTSQEPARTFSVAFENLKIQRGDDGAALSGTLLVNGKSIDAGTAPNQVKRILIRLVRFLRY